MTDSLSFHEPRLIDEIRKFTRMKKLGAGDLLMSPGDKVVFLPVVLKGALRIIRQSPDDKEIFLYHVYPAQTCALAINCCQSGKISPIKVIAEEDTEIMLIPAQMVDDWHKFPEWKAFINGTYSLRFGELLEVVDLVAFNNMDKQVLHYLQERCRAANTRFINITHQEIADELHAHREAISRLLRTMEQKQMVRLGRNFIELLTSA